MAARIDYPVPPDAPTTTCRSCGALVVWTTFPTGRRMPLALKTAIDVDGVRRAESHFSDCPQRDSWRKERK